MKKYFPVVTAFLALTIPGTLSSLLHAQSSLQLEYFTYLGGNNTEFLNGIDLDPADNIHICGSTYATNFTTVNSYQKSPGGATATALSPSSPLPAVSFSTRPTWEETAASSSNFPIADARQGSLNGNNDAFISVL